MKRILSLVLILVSFVSVASAGSAFDLENMSSDELRLLKNAINTELVKRGEDTYGDEFTVDHNDEYYETQQYIWDFLTKKGYEVQTIFGTPNIGRYEDLDPNDSFVSWYAFVNRSGEWKEFVVTLFSNEVSGIMPKK